MYEHLRNDFIARITNDFSKSDIDVIIKHLDFAIQNYDVTEKQTSLVVYQADEIPNLVKTYIGCKKVEGLSDNTLKQYLLFLKMFFQDVMKSPEEIVKNDIIVWLYRYKQERQVSDRTLDKIREYICRFFNWCCDEGYIQSSPARTIKAIKYEQKERPFLTQIELEYIRNACSTLREKALVEFFYSTGARVSEVTILKKSDIDFVENTVYLYGKGKKHRTSYMNAKCKVALKRYLESRTDSSEYVFVTERKPDKLSKESIEKIISNISSKTNINKRVTPHVFRHTTATQGIENGMPVETIQSLLGHESISTTMIYAKTSKERVKAEHTRCVI